MKKVLPVLLTLIALRVLAQDQVYIPGYVVTKDGVKIQGTIQNDFIEKTIFTVNFKDVNEFL